MNPNSTPTSRRKAMSDGRKLNVLRKRLDYLRSTLAERRRNGDGYKQSLLSQEIEALEWALEILSDFVRIERLKRAAAEHAKED